MKVLTFLKNFFAMFLACCFGVGILGFFIGIGRDISVALYLAGLFGICGSYVGIFFGVLYGLLQTFNPTLAAKREPQSKPDSSEKSTET